MGGQLALGGATLSLNEKLGFSLAVGQTFYLFDNPGTSLTQGTFGNAPQGIYTDTAGGRFTVNYLAGNPADGAPPVSNDVSLTVLSVVPEPGTWTLLGFGTAGWLGLRRRRAALRWDPASHAGGFPGLSCLSRQFRRRASLFSGRMARQKNSPFVRRVCKTRAAKLRNHRFLDVDHLPCGPRVS